MSTENHRTLAEWCWTIGAGALALGGSTLLLVWHLQDHQHATDVKKSGLTKESANAPSLPASVVPVSIATVSAEVSATPTQPALTASSVPPPPAAEFAGPSETRVATPARPLPGSTLPAVEPTVRVATRGPIALAGPQPQTELILATEEADGSAKVALTSVAAIPTESETEIGSDVCWAAPSEASDEAGTLPATLRSDARPSESVGVMPWDAPFEAGPQPARENYASESAFHAEASLGEVPPPSPIEPTRTPFEQLRPTMSAEAIPATVTRSTEGRFETGRSDRPNPGDETVLPVSPSEASALAWVAPNRESRRDAQDDNGQLASVEPDTKPGDDAEATAAGRHAAPPWSTPERLTDAAEPADGPTIGAFHQETGGLAAESAEDRQPEVDAPLVAAPPVVVVRDIDTDADGPEPGFAAPAPAAVPLRDRESVTSVVPQVEPAMRWPRLTTYQAHRTALVADPATATWAEAIDRALSRLDDTTTLTDREVDAVAARLVTLAELGEALVEEATSEQTAEIVSRLTYSLQRRGEILAGLAELERARQLRFESPIRPDAARLTERLDRLEAFLAGEPTGPTWTDYLQLPDLRASLEGVDPERQRVAAIQTLLRLDGPTLTPQQRTALTIGVIRAFRRELVLTATGGIEAETLLMAVHEAESRQAYPRKRLAWQIEALLAFSDPAEQAVGTLLRSHYANANVRVAVSAPLLAKVLPVTEPTILPIRESIRGADVTGYGQATTQLGVRLIPTEGTLTFALAARGTVVSETAASRRPATFYSDAVTHYEAARVIGFDGRRVVTMPTELSVQSNAQTRGLVTDYDNLPLIGSIVRDQAFRIHDQEYASAKGEIDARIENRIRTQFDQSVDRALAQADEKFNEKLADPMSKLGLRAEPVALSTTPERLIARYRMTGPSQLAGDSPRPLALAGSDLSLQVHQSAIENALERSGLFGREMTLREFITQAGEAIGRQPGDGIHDVPADISIELAEHDGLRIGFVDDHIEISLAIRRIIEGGVTKYRNFVVKTTYRPVIDGLSVELERDGIIMLEGRVPLGQQVALRAIFNKVFPSGRRINITPETLRTDPRLSDLAVGQCVMADGWLAVSLVPTRASGDVAPAPPAVATPTVSGPVR